MKPTLAVAKQMKPPVPSGSTSLFKIPPLSSISTKDLPNNGFGHGNYYFTKTKFGHWPVYKKIQNTKITTEIKRIQGDINQFRKDLIDLANINPQLISVNKTAGFVNVKGDRVEDIKRVFDEKMN